MTELVSVLHGWPAWLVAVTVIVWGVYRLVLVVIGEVFRTRRHQTTELEQTERHRLAFEHAHNGAADAIAAAMYGAEAPSKTGDADQVEVTEPPGADPAPLHSLDPRRLLFRRRV